MRCFSKQGAATAGFPVIGGRGDGLLDVTGAAMLPLLDKTGAALALSVPRIASEAGIEIMGEVVLEPGTEVTAEWALNADKALHAKPGATAEELDSPLTPLHRGELDLARNIWEPSPTAVPGKDVDLLRLAERDLLDGAA